MDRRPSFTGHAPNLGRSHGLPRPFLHRSRAYILAQSWTAAPGLPPVTLLYLGESWTAAPGPPPVTLLSLADHGPLPVLHRSTPILSLWLIMDRRPSFTGHAPILGLWPIMDRRPSSTGHTPILGRSWTAACPPPVTLLSLAFGRSWTTARPPPVTLLILADHMDSRPSSTGHAHIFLPNHGPPRPSSISTGHTS